MIEKIAGHYSASTLSTVKAKKWQPGINASSDEASFSLFAVELARVSGELRGIPEVREDLVDDFKKKVASGEYHPPIEKIAHQLFLAGILNNEE